ncbi:MAG: tryptophan synthase subunit beta [Lentisphaeria bacterium]|nr:tryptophan synthase subunit beta [Lentisphaeria bacterium]NQZ69291.1 tryptophan synthase subunit beta [Lentisphaeria bacterium]
MKTFDMGDGHYGEFGGQYIAETLMPAIKELGDAFSKYWVDDEFIAEFRYYLKHFVGRPSSLYFAENLTRELGGAKIYLKREDLNHTGAHKINNTIGQILLAKRMGKTRIIAETGAGQHGVATATASALFGLECDIFMGVEDIRRQAENVKRMKLLGADVIPVSSGTGTLKDAMNDALRNWVGTVDNTFYCCGTVAGPHPYPLIVREFQKIIGEEAKSQILEAEGRLPDTVIACIGGGSNAMGIFYPFIDDKDVELIGVEAAGLGVDTDKHAASITGGAVGVLHGSKSFLLQNEDGQITDAHSISAGLDYPGVGPEHSFYHQTGQAKYVSAKDDDAAEALLQLTRIEGIIPALESAHALAYINTFAPKLPKEHIILVCLSGRGDKDMLNISEYLERKNE